MPDNKPQDLEPVEDTARVSDAVKGVRAVENMNVEIEALRRQVSQQASTITSMRAENYSTVEANNRLQIERDYYMNQVVEIRTHLEVAATQSAAALLKANKEVPMEKTDSPGTLAERFAVSPPPILDLKDASSKNKVKK